MNSTDTTWTSSNNSSSKEAFIGSDMWNTVLGANTSNGAAVTTTGINSTLYSIFGSALLRYRDLSTSNINSTAASAAGAGWTGSTIGWQWHDCYATLLNECEVFGGPVFSSSGLDIGIKKAQLPLFTLNPELIVLKDTDGSGIWYWLKNVADNNGFCCCYSDGRAYCDRASTTYGLRLEFLLSA